MIISLYNFNNYYNRQIKGYEEIEDYGEPVEIWEAEFNPNDGITTSIKVNSDEATDANYLVVCGNDRSIVSRWFVLNYKRLRAGQYELSLYRDLIYDYYNEVVSAPCFIEKATVGLNSPFIFNKENMIFNQIKKQEIQLRDKFGLPWIVGYIARNTEETNITVPLSTPIADYEVESFSDYEYNQYRDNKCIIAVDEPTLCFNYSAIDDYLMAYSSVNYSFCFDKYGNAKDTSFWETSQTGAANVRQRFSNEFIGYTAPTNLTNDQITNANNYIAEKVAAEDFDETNYYSYTELPTEPNIMEERGKIIKVRSRYYTIQVNQNGRLTETANIYNSQGLGTKARRIRNYLVEKGIQFGEDANNPTMRLLIDEPAFTISYEPLALESVSLVIPGPSQRTRCVDSPYDIFAIPCGDYLIDGIAGAMSSDEAIKTAMSISTVLGSKIYDLQLLPYAPIPAGAIPRYREIYPQYWGDEPGHFQTIKDRNDVVKGCICWLSNSSFETTIPDVKIDAPKNALEAKIMNETKLYRLCSPNYSGVFEINAAKNGGLYNFTAYCSYKPGSPYIQVVPQFNRLYGSNFNDARGLICGGDFSLPMATDAWVEYINQNKNYNLIFDRQVENLEVNNQIARDQQNTQGIVGIITDTISGLGFGSMLGSGIGGYFGKAGTGIGAGVGGVLGGIAMGGASAVGFAFDKEYLKRSQTEAVSYMKDQHALQIGSIQAQPYSLSKVSAFNINNKIFPFLEIYEATNEEVQAFTQHLTYAGMTVNAMGTIEQYQQSTPSFIRGKIIRLEIDDNFEIADMIANEIAKGVYI